MMMMMTTMMATVKATDTKLKKGRATTIIKAKGKVEAEAAVKIKVKVTTLRKTKVAGRRLQHCLWVQGTRRTESRNPETHSLQRFTTLGPILTNLKNLSCSKMC